MASVPPKGYFIEELSVGMSADYPRTISENDIQMFGDVSGDHNPVHFDEEYAKTTIFKGRIAHGMLSAAFLSTVLGTKLPGPGTIFMSSTLRFKAPVRIGETVVSTCTVREIILPKKRVVLDLVCKVGDTVVVDGEALVMVPSNAG
jgi:3-hydroxybutyryl-CoA dehydratase